MASHTDQDYFSFPSLADEECSRAESMDLLWEEFNFGDQLLLRRLPSSLGIGDLRLGLEPDSFCLESCASENCVIGKSNGGLGAEATESYRGKFQLQPLDLPSKEMIGTSGGRVSPRRSGRTAAVVQLVRRLLLLNQISRREK